MINKVIEYINNQLTDINTNYGLCERVEYNKEDDEYSHIKQIGENGAEIDFDKVESLSYILPDGEVTGEELDGDLGGEITQRLNYNVNLVIYKKRCELPELDEIYNVIQQVATNNAATLVTTSKAFQGAKITFNSATQNKREIFERDFIGHDFRIGLNKLLISLNFTVQLDLDLSCDNITTC